MSNIIKSSRIIYNEAPKSIGIRNTGGISEQQSAKDVGQKLSNNALESADASLRLAVSKAEEVKNRSIIEAHFAYSNAVNDGRQKGHEEGILKGRSDGSENAAEDVRNAAEEFTAKACSLDMKYLQRLSTAKADCVDFAFSLAEDILGIQIDRKSENFSELLSGFLAKKPGKATLEADGCEYKFESFRPDGLLSAADGLKNISVSVEALCEDEKPEAKEAANAETYDKSAELEQNDEQVQIDSDTQGVADVKTAVENQSMAVEDSLTDEIESGQDEQNENFENQPEPELEEYITDMSHISEMPQLNNEMTDTDAAVPPQMQDASSITDEVEAESVADSDADIDADSTNDDSDIIDSEKFVFVRPERKSVLIPSDSGNLSEQQIKFEDIARIGQDNLKVLSRKAEIKDIAAALSEADENVSSALMNAMARRKKENLLDVMKYLGPVSQKDTDDARNKIAKIATDIMKAHERNEADV